MRPTQLTEDWWCTSDGAKNFTLSRRRVTADEETGEEKVAFYDSRYYGTPGGVVRGLARRIAHECEGDLFDAVRSAEQAIGGVAEMIDRAFANGGDAT